MAHIIENFRANKKVYISTSLVSLFWVALGIIKSMGINSILLMPFYFLTGALAGVDGGNFWGGTIGKIIILSIVNSFIKTMIFTKEAPKDMFKTLISKTRSNLMQKIPNYNNIKQLFTNNPVLLSCNILGVGTAFILYPFLSGNGSLQNSGVCIFIVVFILSEIKKQRGFIITLINIFLKKMNKKKINKEFINRVMSGSALGFSLTIVFAGASLNIQYAYLIGGIAVVIGAIFILFYRNSLKKLLIKN